MTREDAVARLLALVAHVAGPERTPPDAGPDTRLSGGGFWLDSVAMLELIVTCEERFGVTFDSEGDLTRDTLGSVGTLAAVIARKVGVASRPR